jgi:dTDP-4-dehydrorhamnose reductase
MDKRRVIVTGAAGQLGVDMVDCLQRRGWDVYGLSRLELDITDRLDVNRQFDRIKPHAVVHAAAFTNVDRAEIDPELAFLVNAFGTKNVAVAAERYRAKMAYVSTDYVFAGKGIRPYVESDRPAPLNVYGSSKLGGEKYVRNITNRYFIVRTSWVYGAQGANFVKTMLRLAREQERVKVVYDQVGSPTYTVDLAERIADLLVTEKYGVYHVSGSGSCSWYEFAKAIYAKAGVNVPVIPVTTDEFPRPARRPNYSVMDHMAMRLEGFAEMRHWKSALDAFLAEKQIGVYAKSAGISV